MSYSNKDLINSYLQYIQEERQLSDNTVNSYVAVINSKIIPFLTKSLTEYTKDDVRQLLNNVRNISTVNNRNYTLIVLNNIFDFLVYDDKMLNNPAKSIPKLKEQHKTRHSLSKEDALLLVKTADDFTCSGILPTRDKTIVQTLLYTGLRISEAINLKYKDVDINNKLIKVVSGKGNKDRYVPIPNSLVSALTTYINERDSFNNVSEYFFISRYKDDKTPMTRQNIYTLIKKLAKSANIPEELVSPHILRHTYATLMLQNGVDLMVISKCLGHTSISTTQIYAEMLQTQCNNIVTNTDILA